MKYSKMIAAAALCVFLLTGCSRFDYSLPDSPLVFREQEYTDEKSGDSVTGFEYNGRDYAIFGTAKGGILSNEIGECLGYLQDENAPDDKNARIMKLTASDDFLMSYYVGGIIEGTNYYRALDTKGQDIEIPEYICDLGYSFWGSEN